MANPHDDHIADLIVVGSGAGALAGAITARLLQQRVLVVEKAEVVGGSTALSGGVVWLPNSGAAKQAGLHDSFERALEYFNAVAGEETRGSSQARRRAFLTAAPAVADTLEAHGMKFYVARDYADYYEGEFPGASTGGRSLQAHIFDARALGAWRGKIRRHAHAYPPVRIDEAQSLMLNGRTFESQLMHLRTGVRLLRNRLGADLLGMGGATYGRLLKIALDLGVEIWTESPVNGLIQRNGAVHGVSITRAGAPMQLGATHGVLLAAGGFAHNQAMRDQYANKPIDARWSAANPGDTGEVLRYAMAAGAAVEMMQHCVWNPISITPEGAKLMHSSDFRKPHCLLVDQSGARFLNEATDYVKFGRTMYERNAVTPAVPSWMIIESRHRRRYRLAGVAPGEPPASWISSGYMIKAHSLEDLAAQCAMDWPTLRATIARFNGFARSGVDEDFGRGGGAFHRFRSDPSHGPNPTLGAIEDAPFYAIRIYPGDVGTFGGLVADEHARVLREDGAVIPGLYAAGNITSPVTGRGYPGAGASIAPALVFGYIAARHALGANA